MKHNNRREMTKMWQEIRKQPVIIKGCKCSNRASKEWVCSHTWGWSFSPPFLVSLQASAYPAGSGQVQSWRCCRGRKASICQRSGRSGAVRAAQQARAGEIHRVCQGTEDERLGWFHLPLFPDMFPSHVMRETLDSLMKGSKAGKVCEDVWVQWSVVVYCVLSL